MSELLIFPDQHLGEHRRPQNVTAKQKVTRTIGACLFAIGTTIGLKYGFDAITENQTGTELVASASASERITTEQSHAAAHNSILETIDGMRDVMYSVGGFTTAIGVSVVGMAAASRRHEHATVPGVQLSDEIAYTHEPETVFYTCVPELVEASPYPTLEQVSFEQLDWNIRNGLPHTYC